MSYKKEDILLAIINMVFIITFAICLTVFIRQLYYFDIGYLNIDHTSGMSVDIIKKNYDILIDYQSVFYQGTLSLPNFIMSEGGRIHFEEVKKIFEIIQVMCVVSGVLAIIGNARKLKKGYVLHLHLTSILTLVTPSAIGLLASIDFDQAFIIFHRIFFRNDFWIFDVASDPVITILPQIFFMHCFIMIIVIVLILSGISYMIYRIQIKKEKVMYE